MIHYHGGPIFPEAAARSAWRRGHAMISFAYPKQAPLAFEVAQSVILDNGAFTAWKNGDSVDVAAYAEWVRGWMHHPGFDWCLIPDIIDGSEQQNDEAIGLWLEAFSPHVSVPVWHLHESLERLERLVSFPRLALGSSGEYAEIDNRPGSRWWTRISEAMEICCDKQGRPRTKLHGLRMLDPTITSHVPLSSADSTNCARNVPLDSRWEGPYEPMTKETRAALMVERIEFHATASFWAETGGIQQNLGLVG